MSKLLLLIIAVVVVYFLLTGLARKRGKHPVQAQSEPMVPCAHCGVNLPRSEALEASGGRFFCSEEHRRLGAG